MSTDRRDERLDDEILRFLDMRASDTSRIRSAPDMSMAIAARVLSPQNDRRNVRLAWSLAAVSLIALMAASALFVGSRRLAEVVPDPGVLPAPTVATLPSLAPATTIPVVVRTGTAATALGQFSWTRLSGTADNLPAGDIFETGDGYAALEPNGYSPGARLWVSPNGIDWSIAPVQLPATDRVSHEFVAGEHWLWTDRDLAMWRSTNLDHWSKVDLASHQPPAVDGIDWVSGPSRPVTVGSTTLVRWGVVGWLALDRLLGIPVSPGERLIVSYRGTTPALGAERDVVRVARDSMAIQGGRVGGIRVEMEDPIVRIVDADRDRVVAEIDTATIGMPAKDVARILHTSGRLDLGDSGVAITDGFAADVGLPADLEYLVARDGRFVAMTKPGDGDARVAWTSTNGRDWESAGAPRLPEVRSDLDFVRSGDDPQSPLVSSVFLNTDPQREELWTSADGIDWDRISVLSTDLRFQGRTPWPLRSGGFLALTTEWASTGETRTVEASTDGVHWTPTEGLTGVGSLSEGTGVSIVDTRESTFIVESTNGRRIIWVLDIAKP